MKCFFLFSFLFILVACQSKSLNENYSDSEKLKLDELYGQKLYYPIEVCDNPKYKAIRAIGAEKYSNCVSFLSTELKQIKKIITEQCKRNKNKKNCLSQIGKAQEQYNAKMILRYNYADFEKARLQCTANGDCDDGDTYESSLLVTHNTYVDNKYKQALRELNIRRQEIDAADRSRTSSILQSFGDALKSTGEPSK